VLIRDTAARIQDQTRLLIKLLRTSMQTTNILTSYAVREPVSGACMESKEYLVAGAIVLEMFWTEDKFVRSLIIEKMRCTNTKPAEHHFDIVRGRALSSNLYRKQIYSSDP
jgi:KaiC/GvpD/RAD55 family RecA-like ATPase